jgi:16S rRNA (uracil1498-N3)-methyltransferase
MPIERYYLDESIQAHELKSLKGAEFHHLSRVTRVRPGEKIELVNGKGVLAQATVQTVEKERAVLQIDSIEEKKVGGKVILAQAMPKVNRLDFILEKGTELGVDEFWLFPGDLSLKKDFSENQFERAHAITIAAMKQCGRLTLPLVKLMPKLEKWPEIIGTAYFGDVDPDVPSLFNCWEQGAHPFPILFFVGPESGWSASEMACFRERGVKGVKLHENILRTDTASLAAISLIRHFV